MTPADAADALQYWVETGFLFRDETESHRKAPASAKAEQPPKKKLVEVPSDVLPTYETVADRMLEDPQLPATTLRPVCSCSLTATAFRLKWY